MSDGFDSALVRRRLTPADVQAFVESREVELVIATPPDGSDLYLKACFDGYNHFFGVSFFDVEYVAIPGGMEVKRLFFSDFGELASIYDQFRPLEGMYSGPAMVVCTHEDERHLVVAARIEIAQGPNWP
jgi:hypothetical protein